VARIFLSYRRDDSSGHAGRLFDRLSQHFGRDNLFMDVDTIALGLDFVEVIQEAVGSCDVLLAVIGRQWLTSTDVQGQRRLDNPEDFVRLEITAALERRIRVIPVLVGGVSMPRSTELPGVLRPLARRQALVVGDHFHPDVDRLIAALETVLSAAPSSREQAAKLSTASSGTPPHDTSPITHSLASPTALEPSFGHRVGGGPSVPTFDVFLSHSSVDNPWVIQLKDALQRYGVSVWLDRDEIRPGDLFVKALETGLEQSWAVALIVSPEAIASGWLEEEYARAMSLAQNKQRPLQLIPVLLRDSTVPGFLQGRHLVDFRDERAYDQKVWELAWGITGQKPPKILDLTTPAASMPTRQNGLWVRGLRCLRQYRLRQLLLPLSIVALVSLILYVLSPYLFVIRAPTP
jgi:hypothetical protein